MQSLSLLLGLVVTDSPNTRVFSSFTPSLQYSLFFLPICLPTSSFLFSYSSFSIIEGAPGGKQIHLTHVLKILWSSHITRSSTDLQPDLESQHWSKIYRLRMSKWENKLVQRLYNTSPGKRQCDFKLLQSCWFLLKKRCWIVNIWED